MRSKQRKMLGALALTALCAAAFAAPASAYHGSGQAVIVTADHDRGRTLSGQGAKLVAGPGASANEGKLTLPIAQLQPTATNPSASSTGSLGFRKGKRSVGLSGLHFDLTAGTLVGNLGGTVMPVFRLGAPPLLNGYTGSIVLSKGVLRFTSEAAKLLRSELELERALRNNGVGMIWLSAQASPTHAPAQPVVSGSVSFGFAATWRSYILGAQGPPMSIGTITLAGGASASGNLAEPAATINFPVVSGTYHRGLFGAGDRLTVSTAGSVDFAKPFHCIDRNQFSGLQVSLNGASGSLQVTANNLIGQREGMKCTPAPTPKIAAGAFANLAAPLTGQPVGNMVTWTGLPATLTQTGAAAWGNGYQAGKALDPVSITVGLG